jgi:hypothetical protein
MVAYPTLARAGPALVTRVFAAALRGSRRVRAKCMLGGAARLRCACRAMDEIQIVDNTLISVWVYPQRRIVHHRLKMFCYGDELRQAFSKGAEAMEQHKATKWLSDDRAHGALVPDDQIWLNENWFPRVMAAGWKHWAIVQPTKIIGQSYIQRVMKLILPEGITAHMFGDPDEAMRWLLAQ